MSFVFYQVWSLKGSFVIHSLKEQLTRGKLYADKMFNQEPLDLGGDTFTELKSLWEEMNRAADTVFPVAEQRFGRNYPLSSLPSPSELEKTIPGAASLDKFDKFETRLDGALGLIFKSGLIPLFFAISLITKFFGKKVSGDLQAGLPILLFMGTTFFVFLALPIFSSFSPILKEILAQKISGSSGLFVDYPQTLLIWGVIYYISLSIADGILFIRGIKNQGQVHF